MEARTLRLLELDRVLERLAENTASGLGRTRVRALKPSTDVAQIRLAQATTTEARRFVETRNHPPFGGISDLETLLKHASIGAMLEAASLLQVAQFAGGARRLRENIVASPRIEYSILHNLAMRIVPRSDIEKAIFEAIDENSKDVKDDASLDLLRARRNIRQTQSNIQQRLRAMLSDPNVQPHLQDAFVTVRDGRYCLPVKAEARRNVPGITHDRSGSGGAFFVEPQAVVEMNNRLRELQAEEREAVIAVLQLLSSRVAGAVEDLSPAQDAAGELDFAFAKAELSLRMEAVEPQLLGEDSPASYTLRQAQHPLVQNCVPNDILLGDQIGESSTRTSEEEDENGFDVMLITGPNTGGKTVVSKTLGLLTLMSACGLHIPAAPGSRLKLPRQVFADIGDEQSIEQSLSTFSSHIKQIVHILNRAQKGDLVLLDEAGAGTDPDEGAALAKAVLRHLQRRGVQVMATTHYGELKHFALSARRFRNASVEFDVKTLKPTYRLRIGVPGASNALDIASRLGMPNDLIGRARRYLGRDRQEAEAATQRLEETQRELSERSQDALRERSEVEQVKIEYSKRLEKLQAQIEDERAVSRREAETIVRKAQEEADAILRDLRSAARESKQTEDARQKLRDLKQKVGASSGTTPRTNGSSQVDSPRPNVLSARADKTSLFDEDTTQETIDSELAQPIRTRSSDARNGFPKVGDGVLVKSFNKEGVLLSLPDAKNRVEVRVGAVKVQVDAKDVAGLKSSAGNAGVSRILIRKGVNVADEINLIGQNTEDALDELAKYIDDALLADTSPIRIVHGKGTGTLRKAIHSYLGRHSAVSEFNLAPSNEGGEGATIAVLD